jgi:hypothetical protein
LGSNLLPDMEFIKIFTQTGFMMKHAASSCLGNLPRIITNPGKFATKMFRPKMYPEQNSFNINMFVLFVRNSMSDYSLKR